jgi:UDP-N-acetylmuramoyl-tripeptide--D-alanyl-D-alanine ligase
MINHIYNIYRQHPEICIDTRQVSEACIFFALKGPNFNANEFAIQALEKGAAFAVVDEEKYVLDERYILVKDVLKSLQELANYHRKQLKCTIIGITGTNGKTTSKELCLQVLKAKFKTQATKGNLNNHIGVPLSILSLRKDTELAIIEMGANHIGEIDFLCTIAEPDLGIITNVGKAHLEGFGSLEGVLKTKTELYRFLESKEGPIFIKDNQQLLIEQIPLKCNAISYGQLDDSTYKIQNKGAQPFMKVAVDAIEIQSKLIGDYNFDNIALSIAMGLHFGVSTKDIKKAIENYSPTNNRSQIVETENNTILLDAYNANPMSLEKAIHNISNIEHPNKVMILGDMFELGTDTNKEHTNIINHCLNSRIQQILLVGELFDAINETNYMSFRSTNNIVDYIKSHPFKDAFILIKGSRGMKLEQLVELL